MQEELLLEILNVVKRSEAENKKAIEELRASVNRLEEKVDRLETRFDDLEVRFDGLEEKVDRMSFKWHSFFGIILFFYRILLMLLMHIEYLSNKA